MDPYGKLFNNNLHITELFQRECKKNFDWLILKLPLK